MSIYQSLKIYNPQKPGCIEFDRLGYLSKTTKGKRVLHVGCADWPISRARIQSGQLLHQRIQILADSVIGIDTSIEGIRIMRSFGIEDLQIIDAERMDFNNEFDLVLAGDVLEHMNNPGLFLKSAKKALKPGGEVIIAVPSAAECAAI